MRCNLILLFFTCIFLGIATMHSRADQINLKISGFAYGTSFSGPPVDIANGFSGMTIPLMPQRYEKEWNNISGMPYYAPIGSPYGDVTKLSSDMPFHINAILYDSTHQIAEITFERDSVGAPILESYQLGHAGNTIAGAPDYLDPNVIAIGLPSWFTGMRISTGIAWQYPSPAEEDEIPTVYASPGPTLSSQPPLESPVPEPSTLLIFACVIGALKVSGRFKNLR